MESISLIDPGRECKRLISSFDPAAVFLHPCTFGEYRMEEQWPDRVHRVMMSTIDLIQHGQKEQAFSDLDNTLADALQDKQAPCVTTLCRHAAVMAHAVGDRHREIQYTKQALPFAKDRQFAVYNLAQLLLLDGQMSHAEQCASEAYQLSMAEESQGNRDLVTAILKVWPNIAENR